MAAIWVSSAESQMHADPTIFAAVTKLKAGADDRDSSAARCTDQEAGGVCDLQAASRASRLASAN